MPHQYLVVHFDRYNTSGSSHHYVEAESPEKAIHATFDEFEQDAELLEYLNENIHHANAEFSCVAEEESDYLCFRMKG